MSNPFVQRLEHGAALTEDDRAALADLIRDVKTRPANYVLWSEGDLVSRMPVLLKGWACRHQVVEDGSLQITDLVLPGDACHLHAALHAPADHTLTTLTSCQFAEFDPAELAALAQERPAIRRALDWSCLQNVTILRAALTNIGQRRAEKRIAHLICEVHARLQAVGLVEDGGFAWPLTQTNMADATGMTNVHVNRSYKELRQLELFTLKGRVMRVPDAARLTAYCGFRSDYLGLASRATLASSGRRTENGGAPVLLPFAHTGRP